MAQEKLVVHLIMNSHLDPVWLWKLESGIDEVIATARTACDLLDDYPELHLTRGEAWFYETVEHYDPGTFGRLRRQIAAGRLHVVGNWYVQPDCNLASPETYRKHSEIAGAYFHKKFGLQQIQTGYNVDSFGHGAFLPRFYQEFGVRNYCMMRPGPREKHLPGELFRWRSPDGAELLTARICDSYSTAPQTLSRHLEKVVEQADRRIGHTMCFCGVGDHGGGPARAEIDWLIAHRNDRDDIEIRFSHPDAFFDAVRPYTADLPVVTGELQHHAIGCYSACSRIKRAVRETENLLIQAERVLSRAEREKAWRQLLFATFHDLLSGSSIASAYPAILAQLGEARAMARSAINQSLRRRNLQFQPDSRQRLIFDNTARETFRGLVEIEPWVSWQCSWRHRKFETIRLSDQHNKIIPSQLLIQEAAVNPMVRLALPLELSPGERKILFLDYQTIPSSASAKPKHRGGQIVDGELSVDELNSLRYRQREFFAAPLRFDLIRDESDTWSHELDHYPATPARSFRQVGKFHRYQTGALLTESLGNFRDGRGNSIMVALRTESGLPGIRLRLRLHWHGAQQLLKLVLNPAFAVLRREDGCPGGTIVRDADGREYPLFNHCRLIGREQSLALISRDAFAADVQPDGSLRLTLLRTPYYANHQPYRVPRLNNYPVTDQGEHEYEITILADPEPESIAREVTRQSNPVVFSESTLGVRRDLV